jgi:transcriptional regulator with XRE-family HTH domain
MVDSDVPAKYLPSGTVLFPAYRTPPEHANYATHHTHPDDDDPLGDIVITVPLHSSFTAEWPIPVDVPLALRGFRCALGLSQAKFAAALGENRLNIERWEGRKSRPFRGHALSLLPPLRRLVNGPLAAGQLLNFAAAVVCPRLTRPAATYTGHDIAALLVEKSLNQADLAPALLEAFVFSEVLVPIDDVNYGLDRRYIPLVGVSTLDRKAEPWETELRVVAQRLSPGDRKLWLAMGRRLGQPSAPHGEVPI